MLSLIVEVCGQSGSKSTEEQNICVPCVQTSMDNGWLLLYHEEELGQFWALTPLMDIVQEYKNKMHPILDYKELNQHIYTFMVSTSCDNGERKSDNLSLLDLRKAYLQVHIHKSL